MSWSQGTEEERRQRVIEESKQALSTTDPIFLNWLGDESWRVRKEAVAQLSHHPGCQKIIPQLIDAMADEDNAGLRNSAFSLLEILGAAAVEPLLSKVNTPDEGLRKFIIDLLGLIPDTRAQASLLAALKDPCINVRLSAIESLGKVHVQEAAPAIIELIAESRDPISLSTALEALYQLNSPLPVELLPQLVGMPLIGPSLVKVLSISDSNIMGKALVDIAISETYGPTARVAALSCLLPLFESNELSIPTNSDERSRLAEFLTRLLGSDDRDRQILALKLTKYFLNQELLEQGLRNADNVNLVGYLAPIMLTYTQEAIIESTKHWDEYPDASKELLVSTIGRLDIVSCRPLLISVLSDDHCSPQVRRATISALGAIGDISTMKILVEMLNGEDESQSQVAATALKSLCLHLGEESQRVLRSLIRESSPTEITVQLFGQVATEDDLDIILQWLDNDDEFVKCAALKALRAFPGKISLQSLQSCLSSDDINIRSSALALISDMDGSAANETLLRFINDSDLPVALTAIEGLKQHKSVATLETLRRLLKSFDTPKAIAALNILSVIDAEHLPAILELACQSTDPELVKEAIGAMESLEQADQRVLLLPLLQHNHWSIRLMALQMMMAFEITISAELLATLRATETDPMVKELLEEFGS